MRPSVPSEIAAFCLIAGCTAPLPPVIGDRSEAPAAEAARNAAPLPPRDPPAPGELTDEPMPAPEAPFSESGARGAANVVQAYFALIEARRYHEAWRLIDPGAHPRGANEADFAAAFADYAEYRAEVGEPGPIEGAAGSLWIEVPVRVHGRMTDGARFTARGRVQLWRCNDVPGCTAAQRRWRIAADNIGLE